MIFWFLLINSEIESHAFYIFLVFKYEYNNKKSNYKDIQFFCLILLNESERLKDWNFESTRIQIYRGVQLEVELPVLIQAYNTKFTIIITVSYRRTISTVKYASFGLVLAFSYSSYSRVRCQLSHCLRTWINRENTRMEEANVSEENECLYTCERLRYWNYTWQGTH